MTYCDQRNLLGNRCTYSDAVAEGTRVLYLLRSALLALLALVVIGGGSFAAGDLFDDDYSDCPVRTRLRDGQISDLTVARDADEADEVNVAWAVTDPASWGLGPNAYSTSLVVILDDDTDPQTRTVSLGTSKVAFDKVDTGVEVTVQLAIVTDTADGDYVISDILETNINQSLTEPSFSGKWHQLVGREGEVTADTDLGTPGWQYDTEEVGGGMMYYIGYNENFANYRAGTAEYITKPSTPRLRIGLAHSANESDSEREDVDFDAYVIRIVDADGDVVPEADDVTTIKSDYGLGRNSNPDLAEETLNKLFIHDLQYPYYPNFTAKGTIVRSTDGTLPMYPIEFSLLLDPNQTQYEDSGIVLTNVRIVDGSKIYVPMHHLPDTILDREATTNIARQVNPDSISFVKVDTTGDGTDGYRDAGQVFADPPDEHRDFPIDTLNSDETYRITAWAINEDDEVISPVATLKLYPLNRTIILPFGNDGIGFEDYLNLAPVHTDPTDPRTLIITEFTVLK